jgi:hypothetical protein
MIEYFLLYQVPNINPYSHTVYRKVKGWAGDGNRSTALGIATTVRER